MSTHDFRVLRLERRFPHRPAPAPEPLRWELLSAAEADEALGLAALIRLPAGGGRWDFGALSDAQLDRLVELRRRLDGLPAEPA